MAFNLKLPKAVYCGEDAIEQLDTIITTLNAKNVAVFTGLKMKSLPMFSIVEERLKKDDLNYQIYDEIPAEPTYGQVQKVIDEFKKNDVDLIVAVGGGSVLDPAKLASICKTDEYTVKDLLDEPLRGRKTVTTIAIPTTAGTGAEATPNAIVGVPEQELKIGIVNPELIYDYVILDSRMIKDLPKGLSAATGIDALCHAIECFTGNKATPFSDTFALDALDKIMNNIVEACDDPEALKAKTQMQIASFYAGIAITASGTTAVHALSYPLGGKYHIAHGVSNAMLLIPVMEFNKPMIKEKLAYAYDYCRHEASTLTTIDEKADAMICWMGEIVRHLNIPDNLGDFGVPKEDLEVLVEAAMKVTRLLNNNTRTVTADDARKIYRRIMK